MPMTRYPPSEVTVTKSVRYVAIVAAGGMANLDAARWSGLLSPKNPRFLFVLVAGGGLAVEPHWLAALVVYVQRLQSRGSGEDLRLWFERLRSAEG